MSYFVEYYSFKISKKIVVENIISFCKIYSWYFALPFNFGINVIIRKARKPLLQTQKWLVGRMTWYGKKNSPILYAKIAGVLYLIIIVLGIFAEIFVRSRLFVPEKATATATNIMAFNGLFRVGFIADSVMVLSDVALAVLLYILLRPVNKMLALMAMFFRLIQTAVLSLNLLNYYAAYLILSNKSYTAMFDTTQLHSLVYLFFDLHGHGYDLGLLFFGIHCAILGYLILKSSYFPKILGGLIIAAAAAYLLGSYTRFLFPDYLLFISPIYIIALVAEVSMCLWLLVKGINLQQWEKKINFHTTE